MNPPQRQKGMFILEIKQGLFVGRLARVRRGYLRGDDEVDDDKGVVAEDTAEDTACFEVAGCVWLGEVEEAVAEGGWDEDAAEFLAVFKVGWCQWGKWSGGVQPMANCRESDSPEGGGGGVGAGVGSLTTSTGGAEGGSGAGGLDGTTTGTTSFSGAAGSLSPSATPNK
jgi:hypothetical protein